MCRERGSEPLHTAVFSPATSKLMASMEVLDAEAHHDQENAGQPPSSTMPMESTSPPPSPQQHTSQQQQQKAKQKAAPRRRRVSPAAKRPPAAPAAPAPAPLPSAPSKRRRSVLGTVLRLAISLLLLLALMVTTALCAALLVALASGVPPSFPLGGDARPLAVEPPCDPPPPPPFAALPMPTRCRWSWTSFRCAPAFDCTLRMVWAPLPHPACRMRPD